MRRFEHMIRTLPRPGIAVLVGFVAAACWGPAAAGAAKRDPVRTTIERAAKRGTIDAADRAGYLRSYRAARRTLRRLSGQRRAELGYVLGTLRSFARQKRLTARLRPMFLILDRNREWWAKAGPPGSGARLTFGASRVIFQYFPGKGLQIHPLANFGRLNGYWQGRRSSDLRSMAQDLIELAVKRNGYLAWEYYFAFGGGRPPWVSGMAQGTAMQALARAGERLADVRAPALVLWSDDDPYLPAEFARLHADALGGEVMLELVDGGHWPWLARPELVARVGDFVG
jgi:pimeloyl-ACP methyl ester carboxylesterase